MNLTEILWNKDNYQKYIDYLFQFQDLKYRNFHSTLIMNSQYEIIGIKLPIIRDIAKKIARGDRESFLLNVQNKYYEEVMIEGLVISYIKDEKTFDHYFDIFINKIDNWAICDSFCAAIKIIEKKEKYFHKALKLSLNKKEFLARVGLVMLLNHFISKENIKLIFDTLNKISNDKFYVNMAMAWLICELYIKYPHETLDFLKENNLNKFTQNKAISKINDSLRVDKNEKRMVSKLRKK